MIRLTDHLAMIITVYTGDVKQQQKKTTDHMSALLGGHIEFRLMLV